MLYEVRITREGGDELRFGVYAEQQEAHSVLRRLMRSARKLQFGISVVSIDPEIQDAERKETIDPREVLSRVVAMMDYVLLRSKVTAEEILTELRRLYPECCRAVGLSPLTIKTDGRYDE
ncbi:MAG: hypothetical protein D6812_16900 [Deltaproteobacteria bacterium]|nr:MAG: hypothetical protein D6812_16900 [Deltaproteobacteria bacterium]